MNKTVSTKNRLLALGLALVLMMAIIDAATINTYAATKASVFKKAKTTVTLTAGAGSVTVKWKKVKNAKGYQIYRAASKKGKYKKVKTVKKASTIKFVNKKLKEGKTYYYKVRAYGKFSGKTVYSKFSAVKSKKTLTTLEVQTNAFIKKATKTSMTKEQKLKACYTYMRDHYKYIPRSTANTGSTAWINSYAVNFFKDKGGNCYSWAAAYTTVAKKLGYSAKAVAGSFTDGENSWERHCWTEINMGGATYIFDPEMEYAFKTTYNKTVNLYKLAKENGTFVYTAK
ncbi:hypothetical protein LI177_12935 [bacterium 210820-DFI.6.37]|nr:hypothetical protein [bacterium 210820-DFI.6.37]